MTQNKTLIIAVNDDRYLISHRLELGRAAVGAGWHVIAAVGANGGEDIIRANGMEYYPLPFRGNGMSVKVQLETLLRLMRLFRRHPGAVVHLVGMKMLPVGNLAARLVGGIKGIVNAVCGLGIVYQEPESRRARFLTHVLRALMLHGHPADARRPSLRVASIVQNREDEALLMKYGILRPDEVEYIKGSGVDLQRFDYRDPQQREGMNPSRLKKVIFSGRLLHSKGVSDFLKAAELLYPKWSGKAQFLICGGVCENEDSLTEEEIKSACDGEYIRWEGHCSDMTPFLSSSRLMAYPSYYREGVPLAVIEALAVGLPVITCDSVGCRDTVDGNGILVPPRNPGELARAIDILLSDDNLCQLYSLRSRRLAERDFDIRRVVDRHLSIYARLLT